MNGNDSERPGGLILQGNVLDRLAEIADGSVNVLVTSPPFFGVRAYKTEPQIWGGDGCCRHEWRVGIRTEQATCALCGAWRGELGGEPSVHMYTDHLVAVFRAIRRVLRPDATVFVEIGDTYGTGTRPTATQETFAPNTRDVPLDGSNQGMDGQLMMVPARFALAMQADGWVLRAEMIWAKGLSGRACDPQPCRRCGQMNPGWSGRPMPEALTGTKWERHRVRRESADGVDWVDCPGCPKCAPSGGYVLRHGSWRPTRAHTMVYMFTMGAAFLDGEAVKEASTSADRGHIRSAGPKCYALDSHEERQVRNNLSFARAACWPVAYHNLRDVLTLRGEHRSDQYCTACGSYSARGRLGKQVEVDGETRFRCRKCGGRLVAHYAAFPSGLPELLIRAATSARGYCAKCGKPWARVVERGLCPHTGRTASRYEDGMAAKRLALLRQQARQNGGEYVNESRTVGWRPTCSCEDAGEPVPGVVLDPFLGTGSTALAAERLGCRWIGIELNADYCGIARHRLAKARGMFNADGH